MNSTYKKLIDKSNLIFNVVKNIDLSNEIIPKIDPIYLKEVCTEKETKDLNYYNPNFDVLHIKNYGWNILRDDLILNEEIINLFSDENILNIYYFRVWGNVLRHKDPKGYSLGYNHDEYESLLMPINIPCSDRSIFETYYNNNYIKLIEGKFISWDVTNVEHYWKYDFSKTNELFVLLHIDYTKD